MVVHSLQAWLFVLSRLLSGCVGVVWDADSHIEIRFPDFVIHRLAHSRECVMCMCETKITVVAHSLPPAQFC